jgi:hypothetical protein
VGLFDWLRGGAVPEAAGHEALPVVSSVPPAPTPADITAALDRVEALAGDVSLNSAVVARVARVVQRLRETVPRMDGAGLASADQYSLIATATSYLPEALGNYLRLPRDWANSRPLLGGKSALLILIDQLDLLGMTADKMYDAVLQKDARALIEHGRFLEERFGSAAGPSPTPAPAPPAAVSGRPGNPLDLGAP